MNSSVINEWIKIRRSRVIWLFIFVPVVTCFLLTLALGYYLQKGHSPEQGWGLILSLTSRYLWQIIAFTVPVFIAYIVNMEQFSNMWKFLFAMPLAKWKIYVAKFFWGFATTLVMGLLFVFGIYIMAELHDVEHLVTIDQLFSYVYAPFLLAIPFVAFQLCVSMASKNQSVPISFGIASIILAPVFKGWGWWTPWGFWSTFLPSPPLSVQALSPGETSALLNWEILLLSVLFGAIWLLIGITVFYRKEFD